MLKSSSSKTVINTSSPINVYLIVNDVDSEKLLSWNRSSNYVYKGKSDRSALWMLECSNNKPQKSSIVIRTHYLVYDDRLLNVTWISAKLFANLKTKFRMLFAISIKHINSFWDERRYILITNFLSNCLTKDTNKQKKVIKRYKI